MQLSDNTRRIIAACAAITVILCIVLALVLYFIKHPAKSVTYIYVGLVTPLLAAVLAIGAYLGTNKVLLQIDRNSTKKSDAEHKLKMRDHQTNDAVKQREIILQQYKEDVKKESKKFMDNEHVYPSGLPVSRLREKYYQAFFDSEQIRKDLLEEVQKVWNQEATVEYSTDKTIPNSKKRVSKFFDNSDEVVKKFLDDIDLVKIDKT